MIINVESLNSISKAILIKMKPFKFLKIVAGRLNFSQFAHYFNVIDETFGASDSNCQFDMIPSNNLISDDHNCTTTTFIK